MKKGHMLYDADTLDLLYKEIFDSQILAENHIDETPDQFVGRVVAVIPVIDLREVKIPFVETYQT